MKGGTIIVSIKPIFLYFFLNLFGFLPDFVCISSRFCLYFFLNISWISAWILFSFSLKGFCFPENLQISWILSVLLLESYTVDNAAWVKGPVGRCQEAEGPPFRNWSTEGPLDLCLFIFVSKIGLVSLYVFIVVFAVWQVVWWQWCEKWPGAIMEPDNNYSSIIINVLHSLCAMPFIECDHQVQHSLETLVHYSMYWHDYLAI